MAGGNVVAGNVVGGNVVAGNVVGGNVVAGNVVAGKVVGGNVAGVAGTVVGGTVVGGNVVGGNVAGVAAFGAAAAAAFGAVAAGTALAAAADDDDDLTGLDPLAAGICGGLDDAATGCDAPDATPTPGFATAGSAAIGGDASVCTAGAAPTVPRVPIDGTGPFGFAAGSLNSALGSEKTTSPLFRGSVTGTSGSPARRVVEDFWDERRSVDRNAARRR